MTGVERKIRFSLHLFDLPTQSAPNRPPPGRGDSRYVYNQAGRVVF